jgi:hypothetical protein
MTFSFFINKNVHRDHFSYVTPNEIPQISLGGLVYCAGSFKQSVGDRNRVGIALSYRPARLHSLAELVPWN